MNDDPILVLNGLCAFVSLLLAAWVAYVRRARIHHDAFFFFTLAMAFIYLELAPFLALISTAMPEQMGMHMPHPYLYRSEYLALQAAALVGFQIPMSWIYCVRPPGEARGAVAVNQNGSMAFSVAATLFAIGYVVVALRNGLLSIRQGHEALAGAMMSLGPVDFFVFRSYQECALFVIGVLVFVVQLGRGFPRQFGAVALLINIAVYGVYAILNSRMCLVLMVVTLLGWWMIAHRGRVPRALMIRVAVVVGIVGYLLTVALNMRLPHAQEDFQAEHLIPGSSVLDSQGVNRVDCIDLMARIESRMDLDGPALGDAWEPSLWLVKRFWDPQGFDAFRRSLRTTAKSYLMDRYLDWVPPDYPSCCMTDMFGNWSWFGFPLAALLFGWALRWTYRSTTAPTGAAALIIGAFIIANVLYFEHEMDAILVGWTRGIPILLGVILLQPLRIEVPQ